MPFFQGRRSRRDTRLESYPASNGCRSRTGQLSILRFRTAAPRCAVQQVESSSLRDVPSESSDFGALESFHNLEVLHEGELIAALVQERSLASRCVLSPLLSSPLLLSLSSLSECSFDSSLNSFSLVLSPSLAHSSVSFSRSLDSSIRCSRCALSFSDSVFGRSARFIRQFVGNCNHTTGIHLNICASIRSPGYHVV